MNKATNPGRRILALALTVALLLGMTLAVPGPVAVHAEGVCDHVHDEDCGYVAGAPCEHDHDEDCGEDGEDCAHVHDEDCGYIEAAPCIHEHKVNDAEGGREGPLGGDEDCGGLAGSDNTPSLGESGPATPTQITVFAPLDDTVRVQGFDLGDVTLADLVLPETLEATGEDDAPLTVEGVTWACTSPDTGFDGEADGLYTFTPELPDGYTLTDGVALPQITVIVRPDGPAIMPLAINTVQMGDYVHFGKYLGEEILWQVTGVGGSIELLSVYVLWDAQYHYDNTDTTLTFASSDIKAALDVFITDNSNFTPTEQLQISAPGLAPQGLGIAYDRSGTAASYWTSNGVWIATPVQAFHANNAGSLSWVSVDESHGVRPVITIGSQSEYDSPQITNLTLSDNEFDKAAVSSAPLMVKVTGENARVDDILTLELYAGQNAITPIEYTLTTTNITGPDFTHTFTVNASDLQALPNGDYSVTATLSRRANTAETVLHTYSEGNVLHIYAEGEDYIVHNRDAADTTIISMGGQDWYVIGASANAWTLLAKGTMGTSEFNPSDNQVNTYKGSSLQTAIYGLYSGTFSAAEQTAIDDVDLTDISPAVTGARLWPLSVPEAQNISQSLRDVSDYWWLRSPGNFTNHAAVVVSGGNVFSHGSSVNYPYAIRPAFQLNLDSVIFTSDASFGAPGAPDISLTRFSASATPQNLKLTLSNGQDDLNGFSITSPAANANVSGEVDGTVPIDYNGGGTQGGEFLRVRLTQGGKIMYTGIIAAPLSASGGNAVIPLTDVEPGVYQAEIWVEQDGGSGMSNIASKPVEFQLTVTPASTNIAPTINGQTTGTDTISLTEGYAEYTKQYAIAGTPAPTLAITTDNDSTNANITDAGLLTIPTGLTEGTYTIVITASNGEGTATMTVTVEVTKVASPGTIYTITFNENYGSNNTFTTMQTGTDGKLPTLPAAPTRTGSYTFNGWFTQPSGGVEITTNTVFASNDTVYAQWTDTSGGNGNGGSNTYTVTYYANGGIGAPPATASVTAGNAYTVAQPGGLSAPTGQRFVAWNTNSTGSGTSYAPGQTITVTGNLTLYAIWENIPQPSYTVTFDANGGSVTPTSLPTGADGKLAYLPTPTRSGNYVFAGWYTQTNGEGKPISTSTVFAADTTVYAHWTDTSGSGGDNGNGNSGNNNGGSGGGNGGSTEKPAPKTQLPASAFAWDGERTLTINHDSVTALGLLSVQWDGQTLTRDTDYTAHQGSVIIRFSEDYIATQAPGDHTVRVEFLNHYGETTVKLTADTGATDTGTDTHNPNTGGDTQNPQTGDYDPSPWWWLLALIPAAALTIYAAAQLWRRLRRAEG